MQNEREKDLIIEARFHRELIGAKGGNIQKIRDDFAAVQISFPDLGSKSDIVKLRGPKDDVEKCSRTLNKMYKDLLENNYQAKVRNNYWNWKKSVSRNFLYMYIKIREIDLFLYN